MKLEQIVPFVELIDTRKGARRTWWSGHMIAVPRPKDGVTVDGKQIGRIYWVEWVLPQGSDDPPKVIARFQ